MEPTLLVKNNTGSLRVIGPVGDGGFSVRIYPGASEFVPVSLLKACEGNKAFQADVAEGRLSLGTDAAVTPEPTPAAPVVPLTVPVTNVDDLLNS
jgi:hypothetical protein